MGGTDMEGADVIARKWDLAKDAINCLFGVGFGHSHGGACSAYAEIDGDFGIPTASDLQDFVNTVAALVPETAPSCASANTARDGALSVLSLYSLYAFGVELEPNPT